MQPRPFGYFQPIARISRDLVSDRHGTGLSEVPARVHQSKPLEDLLQNFENSTTDCSETSYAIRTLIQEPHSRSLDLTLASEESIHALSQQLELVNELVSYVESTHIGESTGWTITWPEKLSTYPMWMGRIPGWMRLVETQRPLEPFEKSSNDRANLLGWDKNSANHYAILSLQSQEQAISFYETKNDTRVIAPTDEYREILDPESLLKNIQHHLAEFKEHGKPDFRLTFTCDIGNHAVPVSYLTDRNGKGHILVANSFGASQYTSPGVDFLRQFSNTTNLPVYYINEKSQTAHGCRTYAIGMGVLLSRRDEKGRYRISLEKLLERSTRDESAGNLHQLKLPDELLLHSQTRTFIDVHHRESDDSIVHWTKQPDGNLLGENLKTFHERHTNPKGFKDYLRKKSLQYIVRARIHHCLTEINSGPRPLSAGLKRVFLKQMKDCLRAAAADHFTQIGDAADLHNLTRDLMALDNFLESEGVLVRIDPSASDSPALPESGQFPQTDGMSATELMVLQRGLDALETLPSSNLGQLLLMAASQHRIDGATAIAVRIANLASADERLAPLLMRGTPDGRTPLGRALFSGDMTMTLGLLDLIRNSKLAREDELKVLREGMAGLNLAKELMVPLKKHLDALGIRAESEFLVASKTPAVRNFRSNILRAIDKGDQTAVPAIFSELDTQTYDIAEVVSVFCDSMRGKSFSGPAYKACMDSFGMLAERVFDTCGNDRDLESRFLRMMEQATPPRVG
jgi:hypothetical protein